MGFCLRFLLLQIFILFISLGAYAQPPLPGHGQDVDQIFGDLVRFEVTVEEVPVTAGESFTITITAKDGSDQTLTMFNGQVNLSTNNTFGTGFLTENIGGFHGGVLTHSVNLTKAATNATITATHAGGDEKGTTAPFIVQHAALNHFLVEEDGNGHKEFQPLELVPELQLQPLISLQSIFPPQLIASMHRSISDQVAGVDFDIRITAQDAFLNTVSNFDGSVNLTTNNAFGVGVTTEDIGDFSSGVKVHTVNLTQVADDATITAMREGGSEDGTSPMFNILPAPPASINIITQPGNSMAGDNITPTPVVRIKDAFENNVPGVEVNVGLNTHTFAVGSNTIALTGSDGTASFNKLMIQKAGSGYYLIFNVVYHPDVQSENSDTFTVLSEGPAAMIIVTLAEQSVAGQPVAGPPTIKIVDIFNNPVANERVTVELNKHAFADGTNTAEIQTNDSGEAVFDNLVIEKADTGYQLLFNAANLRTLRMPIMNKKR